VYNAHYAEDLERRALEIREKNEHATVTQHEDIVKE